MRFHDLLSRSPVDKTAALVVSQGGLSATENPLNKDELVGLIRLLTRRHHLLRHVLRIKNKRQHTNVMSRWNKGVPQFRVYVNSRAFAEYVLVGRQIQAIERERAKDRAVRRYVVEATCEHRTG